MISSVQKFKVTLFGEPLTLVSDESEQDLIASVRLVDDLMKDLATRSGSIDTKQLALLAAVQLAHQKLQDQSKLMHLVDMNI